MIATLHSFLHPGLSCVPGSQTPKLPYPLHLIAGVFCLLLCIELVCLYHSDLNIDITCSSLLYLEYSEDHFKLFLHSIFSILIFCFWLTCGLYNPSRMLRTVSLITFPVWFITLQSFLKYWEGMNEKGYWLFSSRFLKAFGISGHFPGHCCFLLLLV